MTDDPDLLEEFGLSHDSSSQQEQELLPDFSAQQLLNDLANKNPTFQEYLKKRLINNKPLIRPVRPFRQQQYQISIGPLTLQPGQTETASQVIQTIFRIEKLFASETIPQATVIKNIFVGNQNQIPSNSQIPTWTLTSANLRSGVAFPNTCQPGLPLSITVQNTSSQIVTWHGAFIGQTLIP